MFNILFTGCGSMGNYWMQYILRREDCKIIGFCDIDLSHAREYSEKYNLDVPIFGGINEALESLKDAVNLVIDTTSPDAHELVTCAALRAGCDVLGEKPMAENREGALNQLKAARETGKSFTTMQNRIYQPYMRTMRKAVQDELLGKIGYLGADFFIGAHFGGFRDVMDNVLILDMAVHTFYQARFILGGKPTSVYCHEFNPAGSWYKGNASAIAIFEFDNGAVFEYRGSWCAEGLNTSWECDWRMIGEKGSIKWDGYSKPQMEKMPANAEGFIRQGEKSELEYTGAVPMEKLNGHEGCFDEMFAALNEGRPAETNCEENYISMNMVYAAIESAKRGEKVKITY